ncbi:MAG: tyrosine-protein phosphatase [Promethearchaeota archaeon]
MDFIQFLLPNPPKGVLYTTQGLTKVEIFFVETLDQIRDFLPAGMSPGDFVLLDKEGAVRTELEKLNLLDPDGLLTTGKVDVTSRINEELFKIIYGFEACSSAQAAGDRYRSYFEYNLILHRLVRLVSLARGHLNRLYLPRNFTGKVLKANEIQRFLSLNGVLTGEKWDDLVGRFTSFLSGILDEIEKKGNVKLAIPPSRAINFCQNLREREYILNFRDFASANPSSIREGILFRSSSLERYARSKAGLRNLDRLLSTNKVGLIIDLRWDYEVENSPYPANFHDQRSIVYRRIPFLDDFVKSGLEKDPEKWGKITRDAQFLVGTLASKSPTFSGVLAEIRRFRSQFEKSKGKGLKGVGSGMVIHCTYGKDRTGMVFVLLHLLAGTPREKIIQDYLRSGADTSREKVELIFNFVEEAGGVEAYLRGCGATLRDVKFFRETFLKF